MAARGADRKINIARAVTSTRGRANIASAGASGSGDAVKWIGSACAIVLVLAWTLSLHAASAQEVRDPLIDPPQGAAGSRFQAVGQSGWTAGETVTLAFGFSDTHPGASFNGAVYHERDVTVLRDGTWSFPVAVNQDLFPFPLYRPGFIVVRAQSAGHIATNSYVYTVDGRAPSGLPPLANLGAGPENTARALFAAVVLLTAAAGALTATAGLLRSSGRRLS